MARGIFHRTVKLGELMNPWHSLLRERLHGAPLPVFDFGDRVIPAASLWTASRQWVRFFRENHFAPGTRMVLALEPSPAFIAVLIAGLWESLTICPVDARLAPDMAAESFDASIVISNQTGSCVLMPEDGLRPPGDGACRKRETRGNPDPNTRLLLRTSGTAGNAGIVAISDQNVLSVLNSHLPRLSVDQNSVVASVLPWHHSFGLVLDLMVSLLSGAIVVRDPRSGRDPQSLANLMHDRQVTHLSAVPLTIQRLFAIEGAANLIRQLRGGVLGGAPVCRSLATQLNQTRLRAGYGQTEASPGITLGEPGQWSSGWLGHPVGCEARVTDRGTLAFKGQNACLGYFNSESGVLSPINTTDGWADTGDLVEGSAQTGFTFLGRIDDCFKLSNGRWVEAGVIESQICRLIPEVDEAVVFTHDFETLFVALSPRESMPMPARSLVLSVMGPLAGHVAGVIPIARQGLPRTGKGTIDRRQLSQSVKHAA